MFLVKFFKGLKKKHDHPSIDLDVKKEDKQNNSLEFPSVSQNEKYKEEPSKQLSPELPPLSFNQRDLSLIELISDLPASKPKQEKSEVNSIKIIQKNKVPSGVELNNPENWKNFKKSNTKKKLSIEPLKVKFKEKEPTRKPSISKKNVGNTSLVAKDNSTLGPKKVIKESTVFDKIDKILAKSTAYQKKNKENYEKDLIKILNKNMKKSTSLPPKKKVSYLKKIFGGEQSKPHKKAVLKPKQLENEVIKVTLNPNNNSSLDYFFEENSLRLMEWNEANSMQEIKNLNVSELNLALTLL